ncbi:MAG: hypothetical protein EXS67_01615 [Candidatus Margulisbacteria bacterium]|nr:hypothetical protein [Candidatus Margulisiibacteriota bacterium]
MAVNQATTKLAIGDIVNAIPVFKADEIKPEQTLAMMQVLGFQGEQDQSIATNEINKWKMRLLKVANTFDCTAVLFGIMKTQIKLTPFVEITANKGKRVSIP